MLCRLRTPILLVLVMSVVALPSSAVILKEERGSWPDDWPEELEPLRKTSRTITIGTGVSEKIYDIPIPDRETFEKVWPAILELRTPGSPLTLRRPSEFPVQIGPVGAGRDANARAAIRIYAPTGSYVTDDFDIEPGPGKASDLQKLIRDGMAIRAQAPWPEEIVGSNGELPEYVVSGHANGRLTWFSGDGFLIGRTRARIDMELFIDGKIIDLNRTRLPDGAVIIDRRFEGDHADVDTERGR
jgi:hypothetical protein